IANNNMAGAIRAVSIGRGYDPREFVLVAFGGAGPLHATALAASLGIGTVIVPPTPGVLSTYGLLFTDLQNDYVRTLVMPEQRFDTGLAEETFHSLESEANSWLESEGIPLPDRLVTRSADLRYAHQGWEVTVEVPSGSLTPHAMKALVGNFHAAHERLYTYNLPDTPVELVNLRVTARGQIPRQSDAPHRTPEPSTPTPIEQRQVYFGREAGLLETSIYRREDLHPGATLEGPAVVYQADTTTLLARGQQGTVDAYGNLVIRVGS
ncbi:MAG: hydantoinase/oxoprolinase family protein, partial [Dehalococcoidia bacterium]